MGIFVQQDCVAHPCYLNAVKIFQSRCGRNKDVIYSIESLAQIGLYYSIFGSSAFFLRGYLVYTFRVQILVQISV